MSTASDSHFSPKFWHLVNICSGAGLPVQSAGVAAVTQSSAQSPPVAASPAPPSKEKMAEERDAALEGQNLKMIRVCTLFSH